MARAQALVYAAFPGKLACRWVSAKQQGLESVWDNGIVVLTHSVPMPDPTLVFGLTVTITDHRYKQPKCPSDK